MEITIQQMKKSLLLLNKLHRQKFRSYLVKAPSKLSPDELKKYFTLLFTKKEDHYIPRKTTKQLDIDETEFKKIFVKPTKTPKPKKETAIKRTMKKEEIKENDKQSIIKEEVKEEPMKPYMKRMSKKKEENNKMNDIMKLNDEVIQLFEKYYRLSNITIITNYNNDIIDKTVDEINIVLEKLKEFNVDCSGLTCISNLKNSTELNKLSDKQKYNYLSKIFKDENYFNNKNNNLK